ncbi:hypothetical protein ACFQZ4_31430 [Catellatospora coxensis]|uniref:Uncharacterized protein n=1 Tax=Catellatospora coxensis TaxID=310354 RepID=A0A8J3KX91_9ACTN|nr:hypothetical protein Cco03nite_47020 [Catellatospora coxensis]
MDRRGREQQSRPAAFAHVDETFLTWACGHYAEHRAAIGTEVELARLRAVLPVGGPVLPRSSARLHESEAWLTMTGHPGG